MKIFITGIAGFLGSHLADYFIMQGHEVFGVDNLIGGSAANVSHKAIAYVEDCINRDKMVELTKGMDVIYHCACTAYEGVSVFSPHFITQNTYGITMSVLSAAIENKVKRFVYCSSMARYGTQQVPFLEEMTPRPQDPYGIAKYAAELTIKNLCETHGMEYVIAVPHNIIGPRQKYDDPYRNVASIMINRILQGKQPIIYGGGDQMRCFSYIDDVVEPLARMATADVSCETINIGPDDQFVTIYNLAHMIAGILDFDIEPIFMPARPQEVQLATCSANKARKLLGYETKTSLGEGLSAMIDYIKSKGTRPFQYNIDLEIITDLTPKTWTQKTI